MSYNVAENAFVDFDTKQEVEDVFSKFCDYDDKQKRYCVHNITSKFRKADAGMCWVFKKK